MLLTAATEDQFSRTFQEHIVGSLEFHQCSCSYFFYDHWIKVEESCQNKNFMLKILLFIAFLGWGNASETLAMMDTNNEMTRSRMTSKREIAPENCCTRMMNCLFQPDAIQSTDLMDMGGRKNYGTNIPNEKRKEIVELLGEGNDQILLDPRNGPGSHQSKESTDASLLKTNMNLVTEPSQAAPSSYNEGEVSSAELGKFAFSKRYDLEEALSTYSKIKSDESDTGQKSLKNSQPNGSIASKTTNSIASAAKTNNSIASAPYNTSIQDDRNDKDGFHNVETHTLLMTGLTDHKETIKSMKEESQKVQNSDNFFDQRRSARNPHDQGSEEREESCWSKFWKCCKCWGFSSSTGEIAHPVIPNSIRSDELSWTSSFTSAPSVKSITYNQLSKDSKTIAQEKDVKKTNNGATGGSAGSESISNSSISSTVFTKEGEFVDYVSKASVDKNSVHYTHNSGSIPSVKDSISSD